MKIKTVLLFFFLHPLFFISYSGAQPGILDITFGTNGITTTPVLSGNDFATDMVVQPDDKIVVAGNAHNGTNNDMFLLRYKANGIIDSTFGTDGKVIIAFSANSDFCSGVALQTDGKILVAGYMNNGTTSQVALARVKADGSADSTFGTAGKVILPLFWSSSAEYGRDIAIQTDGKILVSGYSVSNNVQYFAVYSFNSDGSVNYFFGSGNGRTGIDIENDNLNDMCVALTLQEDGKILIGGMSYTGNVGDYKMGVSRFKADGSSDYLSFGYSNNGYVAADVSNGLDVANEIVVMPGGRIILVGNAGSDIGLCGLTSGGYYESLAFGTSGNGRVVTDFGYTDVALAAMLHPWDQVLVVGRVNTSTTYEFAVLRYNYDGSLDANFGTGGVTTTNIGDANNSEAGAVAMQSDGKIVVAGKAYFGATSDVALTRYNNDISVGVQHHEKPGIIAAYPNPFSHTLSVSGTQAGETITLYDALGNRQFEVPAADGYTIINTVQLEQGLYLLHCSGHEASRCLRVSHQ